MEHTNGPWEAKFYESSKTWGVRQAKTTPSVALEFEGEIHSLIPCGLSICNMVEQGAEKEDKANARLIAAAPELKSAIQRLLRQYEIAAPTSAQNVEAVTAAKQAIAKAEQS